MNTQITLFCLIIIAIIMVAAISILALIGWRIQSFLETKNRIDEYNINLKQDVLKARNLLDAMVNDALTEWTVFNVRSEEEGFMNEARQKEAIQFIVRTIIERSTPAIIDQISIGYPADDTKQYTKIITQRALIAVLGYSVKQNTMDMSESLPNSIFN